MSDSRKIRRALLSVYDKTGLVEFARALHDEFNIELISTGGTAKVLKDAGLPVTLVEEITGFPEMLDGRVKTLHPKIHAAILADRDNPEHMRQLAEQGIEPIDMVVVNLYPFEQTIARPDCTFEEAIEMIDIGGPCLLRAAAKNHQHVVVLPRADEYSFVLTVLRKDDLELSRVGWASVRRDWATAAFWATMSYDSVISTWFSKRGCVDKSGDLRVLRYWNWGPLRYGENPHQSSELLSSFEQHGDLDLTAADTVEDSPSQARISFNNYMDANAALELVADLTRAGARSKLGDRPLGDRPLGDRPLGDRPLGDRPLGDRPLGDRPLGDRPLGDRPPVGQTDQRSVPHRTSTSGGPTSGGPTSGGPTSGRSLRAATTHEHFSRRHLPHIERPEATYFVTFRLRSGQLTPPERAVALSAAQFWHGKKLTLHCASVMPDHVHILLTPYEPARDRWVPLGELLKSIKSYSASQINKLRGATGSVWCDENFDRIIRDERDFHEKWDYIYHNPVTAGLVPRPEDYTWFWSSGLGFGGIAEHEADRPEVGPPAVCFIKHTNACGSAVHPDPLEAYRCAYLGDPNAAMGGVLAVNFNVDATFAEAVMETYARWGKAAGAGGFFLEVWLAPSFADDAVQVIRTKKDWGQRVRLLAVGDMSAPPDPNEMDFKRIAGGMLMQTRDLVGLNEDQWKVVTQRQPTESELDDLRLAWLVCKHTKSNAITICRDGTLIGNGAGQMSRVMSCRIATWLAQENGHAEALKGAVAASDAFFPFRDGPDLLIDAGVTALIQPGGSKRDAEVIEACNARKVAMIFTSTRHFRH